MPPCLASPAVTWKLTLEVPEAIEKEYICIFSGDFKSRRNYVALAVAVFRSYLGWAGGC